MTLLSTLILAALLTQARPAPPPPSPEQEKKTVPQAQGTKPTPGGQPSKSPVKGTATDALALQVALDRAGFSPGVIDGKAGSATKKALAAYTKQHGSEPQLGEPTTSYQVTEQDAAGPFEPQIPRDLPDQAKLPALAYKSVVEAVAERFHSTPEFLQKLNPGAKFAAGETIVVPNVEPMQVPAATEAKAEQGKAEQGKAGQAKTDTKQPQGSKTPPAKPEGARGTSGRQDQTSATGDVVVTVSKSTSALTVTDPGGKVLMFAPVTTGSSRDPLPIGEWKVNGVTVNPPFRYNPDLFWDADPSHTKALIKPGPNNPVGLVWIDLSKEHYGIHGTPEPSTVGRTQSHGCVRLTNWDALKLASMVKPGTKVVFTD